MITFGGRSASGSAERRRDMVVHPERAATLATRVARLVALRRTPVTVQLYRKGRWSTVGVCRLPRGTTSSQRRLTVPDSGMYRAKAQPAGAYRSTWSPSVPVRAKPKATFRCA